MDLSVRVACLQFEPVFKNPVKSIKKADELIDKVEPGTLDLLVLPEMAFTGYCFKNREDIAPWIEEVPAGRSSKWAMKTARKLGCYVQVGVPTLAPLSEEETTTSSSLGPTRQDLYYNSIILVNPKGKIELVYHKTFLFETDQTWCTKGENFVTLDLQFPISSPHHHEQSGEGGSSSGSTPRNSFKYSPAICMDLNGESFEESMMEKFEFSNFVKREKVDLVVASNAWLDSEVLKSPEDVVGEGEGEKAGESWEDVRGLISYWVYRMSTNLQGEPGIGFVVCNRTGREGDSLFAGSSCIMELGDRPTVIKYASKKKEELIIAQVRLPLRE